MIVRYTSIEVVIMDGKWKTLTPKASQDPDQTSFLSSCFDKDILLSIPNLHIYLSLLM